MKKRQQSRVCSIGSDRACVRIAPKPDKIDSIQVPKISRIKNCRDAVLRMIELRCRISCDARFCFALLPPSSDAGAHEYRSSAFRRQPIEPFRAGCSFSQNPRCLDGTTNFRPPSAGTRFTTSSPRITTGKFGFGAWQRWCGDHRHVLGAGELEGVIAEEDGGHPDDGFFAEGKTQPPD